jgi:hypothetical protein
MPLERRLSTFWRALVYRSQRDVERAIFADDDDDVPDGSLGRVLFLSFLPLFVGGLGQGAADGKLEHGQG